MKLLSFIPNKFATNGGINRKPGDCDILRNVTPTRVRGSEVTRYGYSSAGLPSVPQVSGSDVEVDFWQYVSTENPSAKEVLFAFSNLSGSQYVHVYSTVTYGSTTWVDGWVLLHENIDLTYTGVSGASDHIVIGAGAGISSVDDYYNGWLIHNAGAATNKEGALVLDYDGTTKEFTLWENVGSGGFGWSATGTVQLYRNYHAEIIAGLSIGPVFTNPNALEIDGLFRINLGKNSNVQAKPIVFGQLKTVVDNVASQSYTWQGTYVSRREILAPPSTVFAEVSFGIATAALQLETEKTYHIGICAIYNGFQRSPLTFIPQADILNGTDDGFLDVLAVEHTLHIVLRHYVGTSDKRITAYEIYVAQDNGNTIGSQKADTPYYFIKRFDLKKITGQATELSIFDASDYYLYGVKEIDLSTWGERGSSWEDASGYIHGVDTMYSCDLEIKTPARQWMGRVNKYTSAREDLDTVYTNPRNEEGLVQLDIFPDQPEVYSHRVKYGDQTYLTGVVPYERGGILALKDQSISEIVVDENPNGGILVNTRTVSERIGCQSPIHGYIKTPYGVLFVAQDDIYLYNGELIGLTKDDWKEDFRAISNATKQASIVWYRPEEGAVFVKLGSDVYAYYLDYKTWRQVSYADALAGYTVKRDGTFVWWKSDGTDYKFDTSSTDAGTAITVTIDTGNFRVGASNQFARIHGAYLNRNQASAVATGSMDLNYEGTSNLISYSSLATSKRVLMGVSPTTRQLADRLKLTHVHSGLVEVNEIEVEGHPIEKKMPA